MSLRSGIAYLHHDIPSSATREMAADDAKSHEAPVVQLVVGKIDAGVAILLTTDHHILEFPTHLLPLDISTGSIIDVAVSRNTRAEELAKTEFISLQDAILDELGGMEPFGPEPQSISENEDAPLPMASTANIQEKNAEMPEPNDDQAPLHASTSDKDISSSSLPEKDAETVSSPISPALKTVPSNQEDEQQSTLPAQEELKSAGQETKELKSANSSNLTHEPTNADQDQVVSPVDLGETSTMASQSKSNSAKTQRLDPFGQEPAKLGDLGSLDPSSSVEHLDAQRRDTHEPESEEGADLGSEMMGQTRTETQKVEKLDLRSSGFENAHMKSLPPSPERQEQNNDELEDIQL